MDQSIVSNQASSSWAVDRVQTFGYTQCDSDVMNGNGITPLMSACRIGSVEIVRDLIQSGVDVNENAKGSTAFNVSFVFKNLDCIKLLMENGAEVDSVSFLKRHCTNKSWHILRMYPFEYLMSLPSCPRPFKIHALELLGAACTDERVNHQFARVYWSRSLEERAKAEPRDLLEPKSQETHPAYGNAMEFQTVEDLDRIASCADEMWMQGLIVRERILGFNNDFMFWHIKDKVAAYMSSGNLDICLDLLLHVINNQQDMSYVGINNEFRVLCDVMKKCWCDRGDYLTIFSQSVDVMVAIMHPKRLAFEGNYQLYNGEFLIYVVRYISRIAQVQSSMNEHEIKHFQQKICKLMKAHPEGGRFHILLVHAIYHTHPHFPLYDFISELLKSGANPRDLNWKGDTALHVMADAIHPDKHRVIKLLLSNCCQCVVHVRNAQNKLFTDYLPSEMVTAIGKTRDVSPLQCWAANSLVKFKIPYKTVIPNKLVDFVKMHL